MSGIKVDKKTFEIYETKFKKKPSKLKFMILGLNKKLDKVVVLNEELGDAKLNPSYADFLKALCIDGKPQWGLIDYEAKKPDGSTLSKIALISWCQDSGVPLRLKMVFGSTTGAVKSKLGIEKDFQASTQADADENILRKYFGLPAL